MVRVGSVPLFAPGVAVIIMKAVWDLTKRSFSDLIDHRMSEEEEKRIKEIICGHANIYAGFHDLKTRCSGPEVFIEFHFVTPGKRSAIESHGFADHRESDLQLEFSRSIVTIPIEPCSGGKCNRCGSFCTFAEKNEKEKPAG
jgi:divalent metal cation (Fe/Co/Zn/Cd) transporter